MSDGFIYVMIAESRKVKVGFSTNPERRAREIKQGLNERAWLVESFPSTRAVEQQVHDMFRPARVKGEWYESVQALHDILDRVEHEDALASLSNGNQVKA